MNFRLAMPDQDVILPIDSSNSDAVHQKHKLRVEGPDLPDERDGILKSVGSLRACLS
jgi:hypothetical protein